MIVTYADLIKGAASSNADERKRAFAVFQKWLTLAPQLSPDQQLNFVERDVLTRIFAQKGFKIEQQTINRRRA
jgi:hypothetical protein